MRRLNIVPYIGITDFTSPEQVPKVLSVHQERVMDPKMDHVLGVGVMMSYKTLHELPTKWTLAFPPKERIADIFIDHEDVYNVLHYADYENATSSACLKTAIGYGGPNLNALQLDMPWPDIGMIKSALRPKRGKRVDLKIILQVGARAMEEMGNNLENVVERILEYYIEGCLDYVLLDKSGGKGLGMDSELLLAYHKEIRKYAPRSDLGIVVAGGLGPTSIHLLNPFRREGLINDLSIDAQGKLRPSGNALDPIDWDMAADYFAEATKFFGWL